MRNWLQVCLLSSCFRHACTVQMCVSVSVSVSDTVVMLPKYVFSAMWVHFRLSCGCTCFAVLDSCRFVRTAFTHHSTLNSVTEGAELCSGWTVFNPTNCTSALFFSSGAAAQRGPGPPHSWGFLDHTQWYTTVGRIPLECDRPVAETSTWHPTLTRDRHPCPTRDSNPECQQVIGRRHSP